MSELDDKMQKKAVYDHISTEDLEKLLSEHSQSSANISMDDVFSILEVIEKREKMKPSGKYTDTDTAWDSFKKNYRPNNNEIKSIYDFAEEIEDKATYQSDIKGPKAGYTAKRSKRPIRHRALIRMACVIASVFIVLLSSTIVARALGYDLWGVVAKWTSETFNFATEETTVPPQINDPLKNEYSDLNETLALYGIKEALGPTWVPDGYMLAQITVSESPKKVCFNAIYNNNESVITVVINQIIDGTNGSYEKDNSILTVYEKNDILHYIMSNNDQKMAVWIFENFECYIAGDISEQDLKKIIDSIYER